MNENAVGGIDGVWVDGTQVPVQGNVTYNRGLPMREGKIGADGVHGYSEKPQMPFIEFEMTDQNRAELNKMAETRDSTVTVRLKNGKQLVLRDAWAAGEWQGDTEEGKIAARFEGFVMDVLTT